MKRRRVHKRSDLSFLTLGMVYIFLFLFLNASFSPIYKLLPKSSSITFADFNSDLEKNDAESELEDTKKLSEISKEFFSEYDDLPFIQHLEKKDQNYYHRSDLLSHHPEKDSPPPRMS